MGSRGARWLPRVGLFASSIGVHGLLLWAAPGLRVPQVARPVRPVPLQGALVFMEHGAPGAGDTAGAQLAAVAGADAPVVEPAREPPVPEARKPKARARPAPERPVRAEQVPEVSAGLEMAVAKGQPETAPPGEAPEVSEQDDPVPAPAPEAVEPQGASPSPSAATGHKGAATASGVSRGGQGSRSGTGSGAGQGHGMGASRAAVLRAYLLRVRDQVAAHQHYPSLARRRGIQGLVRVRLRVDGRGRVSDVRIASGADSELLRGGARSAVAAAVPLPAVPAVLGSELRIEVPVAFRIDR